MPKPNPDYPGILDAAKHIAAQERPPSCADVRTEGQLCSYHAGRVAGRVDCWNLRDERGERL